MSFLRCLFGRVGVGRGGWAASVGVLSGFWYWYTITCCWYLFVHAVSSVDVCSAPSPPPSDLFVSRLRFVFVAVPFFFLLFSLLCWSRVPPSVVVVFRSVVWMGCAPCSRFHFIPPVLGDSFTIFLGLLLFVKLPLTVGAARPHTLESMMGVYRTACRHQ